ncbi:MAG: hypothetical protein QXV17_06705 [Candidatus Micrarchaeaceae archaeon]
MAGTWAYEYGKYDKYHFLCYYIFMEKKKIKYRTTLFIDKQVWAETRKLAIDKGMGASELSEKILKEYLAEHNTTKGGSLNV